MPPARPPIREELLVVILALGLGLSVGAVLEERRALPLRAHVVALQVEFERQILKPVFHLIGYRLWV